MRLLPQFDSHARPRTGFLGGAPGGQGVSVWRALVVCAGGMVSAVALAAQSPIVGGVEVYGARTLSPDEIRRAVGLSPGDALPTDSRAIAERVGKLNGVTHAEVSAVCCDNGRHTVFVGVQEGTAPSMRLRPEPTGFVPMPDEVVRADSSYVAALNEAYSQGSFEEDHSAGHALMQHPRARAAQERFIDLAQLYEDSLRQVLRESRFAMQRALAAQVLGYLPDKQKAAAILAGALDDPSPAVRNDAARALWVIAMYAQDKPAIRAAIPVDPLIAMMKSLEWTDRNKASLVLMALTASRNSALLARLNAEIRPELEEMAAWRTQHAFAPYLVLGRITGKEDAQIFEEFQRRSQ